MHADLWETRQIESNPACCFQWRKGTKGLSVLCLRTLGRWLRGDRARFSLTRRHPFGSALYEAARRGAEDRKNAWLRRMFTQPADKRTSADAEAAEYHAILLDHRKAEQQVSLDPMTWAGADMQVVVNDRLVEDAEELDRLADRIEQNLAPPSPLSVVLDVLVRNRVTGDFISITEQPTVVPVLEGDELQLVAKANQAAFMCLVWVDQNGTPIPMHPWDWRNAVWSPRPKWVATTELRIPPALTAGRRSELSVTGRAGMETIILLVNLKVPSKQALQDLPVLLQHQVVDTGNTQLGWPARSTFHRMMLKPGPRAEQRSPAVGRPDDPVQ
ncbi:MAG TPA: hypothetical protein P5534_05040 [Candidatus Paceibacterota bacterium]|nr:hypothetical protein [Candidatus Paceibacterota bacterium]HRZ55869.1 hypothetical protein [Candidatus Paceibacterota bacterium]